MGRKSIKENKNIYQLYRDNLNLSRAAASELMNAVPESRLEKIENGTQHPTPYDIIQMADAYKCPELCNYYCSHECAIGNKYVPEVELNDLSDIILETIASLNEINPLTSRLVQIARDGKISDDEIRDFVYIKNKLSEVSKAVSALNLWVEKTAGDQKINIELLKYETQKLT